MEATAILVIGLVIAIPLSFLIGMGIIIKRHRSLLEEQQSMIEKISSLAEQLSSLVLNIGGREAPLPPRHQPEKELGAAVKPKPPEPEEINFDPAHAQEGLKSALRAAAARPEPPPVPAAVPAQNKPLTAENKEPEHENTAAGAMPRVVADFEAKVSQIVRTAIQWFIVGDEFRSKNVSKEYAVATTWLVRGAIIIILAGLAFFLKYSYQHGLFPPLLRVSLTGAAGIAMMSSGLVMANKKYHKIAMGLLGGGIAVLYFSVFSAYAIYHLTGVQIAFALMILVTLTAGVLSIRTNSLFVAIFGVIGGYATPVLLHTKSPEPLVLFVYLLLLGGGALFIARYRNWRALNFMSFIFTYALFALTVENTANLKGHFPEGMIFLTIYFMLFSGLSVFYNLIHRQKISILEMLTMLANMVFYIGFGLHLIKGRFGAFDYGAALTVGIAVFYIAQIIFFIKLQIKDRNLLFILFSFAAFAITISLPILLSGQYLLCAWAAQAFLFLWLSGKIQSVFLRRLAYVLYGICFWHFIMVDFNCYFSGRQSSYLAGLSDRFLSMGMLALSTMAAFVLLKKQSSGDAGASETVQIAPENDFSRGRPPQSAIFFWVSFAVIFVLLHFESYYLAKAFYRPLYLPLQTYIWLGALAFLSWKLKQTSQEIYLKLIALLTAALMVKLVLVNLRFWGVPDSFIYGCGQGFQMLPVLIRAFGAIPLLALFAFLIGFLNDSKHALNAKKIYGVTAVVVTFAYLTLELNYLLYHLMPYFRQGGISILWGVFALAMVFTGIRRNLKALRISALILFIVIAVKIFMIDLSAQPALVRTSVFIVLGLVMLAGAFLYIRFKDAFTEKGDL